MAKGNKLLEDQNIRTRLLQVALELFARKGYSATTVREIVAAAGVTKPVLYYYFGNKEGIYLELIRETMGTFTEVLEKHRTAIGDNRERILKFFMELFDLSCTHIDIVRLIHAIFFGPPQGAPYFDFEVIHVRISAFVREQVEAGVARGEFAPYDAGDMAWALSGVFMAAVDEQLCHDHPKINRDGLFRVIHLLLSWMTNDGKKGEPS
jgi:TetR/AcrR family transcriptional regulator